MKFLRKATAAGLAGCMLLTAALPETAAFAVYGDFTSVTQMATSTQEFTAGDLTFSLFENYAEVKKCAKEATEVVIPAEVEGLPVTSIGSLAFSDCPSLTSVTIPDSVTSIGESAFHKCTSLADITIPDGATSIGGRAFNDTPWLAAQQKKNQFVIVNGILIDGTTCTGDVTIPDSVKSIGEFAFYSCKAITSVTIPDGVTSIGKYAFTTCLALTSVNIPDSVVSIGENAFCRCEALPSLTIPASVTSIDKQTFSSCKAFTDFTVPANVTSIAQSAFYGSTSLTSVTILNPDCAIHDEETTFPETAVIKGYSNSSAQAYAKKYNRTFESLGDAPQAAEPVPVATEPVTDPTEAATASTQIYNLIFPKAVVTQGGSKEIKLSIRHDTTAKYIKSIKAGSYTADGLTFTWKAMDLDDKENTLISIPVTVTVAADAATGNHKYSISLENVLVNEDGEIVPLSSFSFEREGTIVVDEASAATEAVTDPTEPATQPKTEPATDPTEPVTEPETISGMTEPVADGYEIKVPDGIKVALNKTATVNVEIVRTTGEPIQKIGSGAAGSTAYGLKWMVTNADDPDRCVVPITISAKDTAGTYTANLIFAVNDKNGGWNNVTAPLNFTIGEVATEPVTDPTEATEPTAYETIDLKFGTPTPFTKEIGGKNYTIKVAGIFAVSGPSVLDSANTADAAIITELKSYVLDAVQHAVMAADFTAENYSAYQAEIRRSAADYFAEKGYNEKTGYTLKSISIANMTVTPDETATEATTQATEATTQVTEATEQLYCIEMYGSWSKPVEYTGEPLTFDLALAESKTPVKEAVFELQNADALPFKVEIGTTITNKEYKDADAALDPDFKSEYPSYYDVILPVKVTMDESAPSGDYTMNFLCKKLVDENGNDLLKHFSPTDLKSTELVSVYKMTLDNQTATNPVDDHLYNISAPEIRSLSVGQEYTFDVEVSRKDGKPVGTINGFRKMGEDDAYYASWETVTSDKSTATVKVTLKAEKAFSGEVDLGIGMQLEGVDSKDINEETFKLTITEAPDDQLFNIGYPEIPTLTIGQEYTFDVEVTRKDGKAIGIINGFRKMGEDDAYYASWETVTSDKDSATVKVTIKAEKPFSGEVDLGIGLQIEGTDIKNINEEKFKLTITEAPDDQLFNIGYPEIPALTVGQEYTFDVEVTRKDGKAIGTINAFRKMGEDDAYYASWETVTSDKSTATVKVTLKAEKAFSGEVDLGLAMQIEGVDSKDINEEKFKLTITEAAAFDPSKIEGLGDVNNDGTINASDAALVLIAAAKVGAGNESGLTAEQTTRADVNGDGIVNASDAAIILQYSAMIGAGGEGTLAEYLKARK